MSHIDIHYVDVSKHTEGAVRAIKTLFQYWFDNAAWHRPSVIVLDNLDALLAVEVEVRIDGTHDRVFVLNCL